jgi:YHS domain-containing protein
MNFRSLHVALLVLSAAFLLSACGAIVAQNPASKLTPVNAVAEGNDDRVLLKGADVIAYFVDGAYQSGLAQFSSQYEGVTFRFASAAHKSLFDQAPGNYLPQFGGYCANGIAYGIPWGGDADTWKMINGKLYIFGGQGSKDAFELDEKGNLALAERYWRDEVAGHNSFVQRIKRLVLRVPHYRSGEDLSRAVAQAKSATGAAK